MAKDKKRKKKSKSAEQWEFPHEVFVFSDEDDIDAVDGKRYFNVETDREACGEELPPNITRRVAVYRLVHEGEITNVPHYNAVRAYDPDENEG